MNKKKLIIAAFAAFAITFTACKKKEDDEGTPETPPTKQSLIAGRTWILDSAANGVNVTVSQATFNSDKTFKNETMTFKPISNGTWEISNDTLVLNRRLFNNGNFNPTRYKIDALSKEKLILIEHFKTSLDTKVIRYYYSSL